MRRFNNPLAPRTGGLHARSAEIKAWARESLRLPDDTAVTVAELACRDAGCPDIETVIGVLEPGKPILTIRIHAPMAEVTRVDLADAALELSQTAKSTG